MERAIIEKRIVILSHALARIGFANLSAEIDRVRIEEPVDVAIDKSAALEKLAAHGKKRIAKFLERYLQILTAASDFSHSRQQEINRILGRGPTDRVNLETLATKVSDPTCRWLKSSFGFRLRDRGASISHAGTGRFSLDAGA
jgi:hypothetical protein